MKVEKEKGLPAMPAHAGQAGVTLIITFFIMIIILAVTLFISILLYSEVKIIRNMGDSVVAFYAADSGVEKVLYYDMNVLPQTGTDPETNDPIYANRGLCTMYVYDPITNPNACLSNSSPNVEQSIYCNLPSPPTKYLADDSLGGCDPETCKNCQITFSTAIDSQRKYSVTAEVYPSDPSDPSATGKSTNFQVESKGSFGSAQRQVRVLISAPEAEDAITIVACAHPISTPQGAKIYICATVKLNVLGTDTIGPVVAKIHKASTGGPYYDANGDPTSSSTSLPLTFNLVPVPDDPLYPCTSSQYGYIWQTTTSTLAQDYYVDIIASDTLTVPNTKVKSNIPPCGGF